MEDPKAAERQHRRILRLLQVREQSRDIASQLRRRAKDERKKQLDAVAAAKKRDFETSRRRYLNYLHERRNDHAFNFGQSHSAVDDDQLIEREWKVQREYNNLMANRRGEEATKKRHEKTIPERKSRAVPKIGSDFKKKYSEKPEKDNQCSNTDKLMELETVSPIYDKVTRKTVDFVDCCDVSKSPDKNLNSNCDVRKTATVPNSIQVGMREADLREKKSATASTSAGFSKNSNDDIVIHNLSQDGPKFLDIVSDFLKRRDEIISQSLHPAHSPPEKEQKGIYTPPKDDFDSLRDTLCQSRHLNSQRPIITHQIEDDLLDSLEENYNPIMFAKRLHSKCKYSKKTSNSNKSYCVKTRTKRHTKHGSVPHWQIGRKNLHCNEKFIKSFDYSNRFLKNLAVDNSMFVERTPKSDVNAYRAAKQETDAIENFKSHQKQISNMKSKEIRMKKLNKIRANKDRIILIRDLESLAAEDAKTELLDQERIEGLASSSKHHTSPKGKKHYPKRETQRKDVNIQTENLSKDKKPVILNNTDTDSSRSLVSDISSNRILDSRNSIIKNVVDIVNDKNRILINELLKMDNLKGDRLKNNIESDASIKNVNSVVAENSRKIVNPKKGSKNIAKNGIQKSDLENGDLRIVQSVSESSRSSFSFKGVQIVIEVKKDKHESGNVVMKDEAIQAYLNTSSSEGVISTSSEMILKKNITIKTSDPNSFYKSDASESTTYMSLPERLTTDLCSVRRKPLSEFTDKEIQTVNTSLSPGSKKFDDRKSHKRKKKNETVQNFNIVPTASERRVDEIVSKIPEKYFSSLKKSTVSNVKNVHPNDQKSMLKDYISRLLQMSKGDVDKINIDVSDVTTPSNSVFNVSLNDKVSSAPELTYKVNRLKQFIKENYKLLDNFKSEEYLASSSTSAEIKTLKKQTKTVDFDDNSTDSKEFYPDYELKVKGNTLLKYKGRSDDLHPRTKPQIELDTNTKENFDPLNKIKKIEVNKNLQDKVNLDTRPDLVSLPVDDVLLEPTDVKTVDDDYYNKLSQQCSDRINDLNKKLMEVRRERSMSSGSSSGDQSASKILKDSTPEKLTINDKIEDIGFIPILNNIPKPLNVDKSSIVLSMNDQPSTSKHNLPAVIDSADVLSSENNKLIPHELSTIIEVDTPLTSRNYTLRSKNDSVASITVADTADSAMPLKSTPFIDKSKDTDVKLKSNEEIPAAYEISPLQLSKSTEEDFNIKPFVSFKDFSGDLSTDTKGDESDTELSSVQSSVVKHKSSVELKRNTADESSKKTSDVPKTQPSARQNIEGHDTSNVPHSGSDISSEFDTWLKKIGLGWAVTTLKKTRDASALTSDSSSFSGLSSNDDVSLDVLSDVLLSGLSERLNISSRLLDHFSSESLLNLSIKRDLENILNKLESKLEAKAGKVNVSDENKKSVEKETGDTKSKNDSQHRTSTPVQLTKSSSHDNSTTTGAAQQSSNPLFSIDSDLSSVKNASNSDKNVSSDDALSVPNVTLKLNKLFDATAE